VEQPPLNDAVIFRMYSGTAISNDPGSINWGSSHFSKMMYASFELIEIAILVFFNNSQPYVGSDGYSILSSQVVSPITFLVSEVSVSSVPYVCATRDVPTSISIAPGALSQIINFSIALCSTASSSARGRISMMLKLENYVNATSTNCSSPEFQLEPFQSITLSVSKDVNTTHVFVAKVSPVPNVLLLSQVDNSDSEY
jgi:hypothetical protein